MNPDDQNSSIRLAFVCVQNAGRSQMAYAFAQRESEQREVGGQIEVLTGGTQPAQRVHDVVVEAMAEYGFDLSERVPREITIEELETVDHVVTMGCSADDVCPSTWNGAARDWDLQDPADQLLEDVRIIRDEIERRVDELFDELLTSDNDERLS